MNGPHLAERIRAGDKLIGALVRMPNPYLTELCGLHGLDYVAFDCEHGPGDIALLHQHVLTARAHGVETLVRLPHHDPDTMLRALDAGVSGVIAPRISTPEQAADVVDAVSYPPHGRRGFATYTPAGRYGLATAAEHLAETASRQITIVIIEDQEGVGNADKIAAVPGITGTLVGPADLAVSFGQPGQVAHDRVLAATRRTHAATRSAGRAVMAIVGTPEAATTAFSEGTQIVLYNLALALNNGFRDLASARPSGRRP